jgi:hypothetical protein
VGLTLGELGFKVPPSFIGHERPPSISNPRKWFVRFKTSVSDTSSKWTIFNPENKKGPTLKPSSSEVRHMSRPKFFHFSPLIFISKPVFSKCVPPLQLGYKISRMINTGEALCCARCKV